MALRRRSPRNSCRMTRRKVSDPEDQPESFEKQRETPRLMLARLLANREQGKRRFYIQCMDVVAAEEAQEQDDQVEHCDLDSFRCEGRGSLSAHNLCHSRMSETAG